MQAFTSHGVFGGKDCVLGYSSVGCLVWTWHRGDLNCKLWPEKWKARKKKRISCSSLSRGTYLWCTYLSNRSSCLGDFGKKEEIRKWKFSCNSDVSFVMLRERTKQSKKLRGQCQDMESRAGFASNFEGNLVQCRCLGTGRQVRTSACIPSS